MSKLLLVEDDNNLREIYEARLQAEGYAIVTAKDGEDALSVAKAEKPDLIISDVMMPKISGFEMLDILKNTDGLKNVKVIMLTALGQSDDQQRANKLGADRYLVKSQVTLEDIVRVTHELLEDGNGAALQSEPASTGISPATTPAPDPATSPTVAAEPPAASTSSTADDTTNEAMTTSEESASIDNQIENFVEGATSTAPTPSEATSTAETMPPTPADIIPSPTNESPSVGAAEPPVTPPAPVTAAPTPMPAPPSPTPTSNINDSSASVADADEKLMNEAVNSLMDDSNAPVVAAEPPVTPQISTPQSSTNSVQPSAPPPPPNPVNSGGSTMSHEKVITPPADSAINKKPDLEALLAAEKAKEASVAPIDPIKPNTNVTPVAPNAANEEPPIDPNSIAL